MRKEEEQLPEETMLGGRYPTYGHHTGAKLLDSSK
jgi:hypothetical protein